MHNMCGTVALCCKGAKYTHHRERTSQANVCCLQRKFNFKSGYRINLYRGAQPTYQLIGVAS